MITFVSRSARQWMRSREVGRSVSKPLRTAGGEVWRDSENDAREGDENTAGCAISYSLEYDARFELVVYRVIVPKGIFGSVLDVKVLDNLALFVNHSL